MDQLSQLEAVERIVIALVLGAVIGFERETKDKPAGLRTYALVCEGAALFMIGSILLGDQVAASGGRSYDPSRIASTIVQGIGFLAGGVILASGHKIRNLTTAAGIWVTAAVGFLIGAGFYVAAIAGTVGTLFVLVVLQRVESKFKISENGKGDDEGEEARG